MERREMNLKRAEEGRCLLWGRRQEKDPGEGSGAVQAPFCEACHGVTECSGVTIVAPEAQEPLAPALAQGGPLQGSGALPFWGTSFPNAAEG